MNAAEHYTALRKIARREAIAASSGAWTWSTHPSYNTKGAVLSRIDAADTLLLAVAEAEGLVGAKIVCGIDRRALADIRQAVVDRKRGHEIPNMRAMAVALTDVPHLETRLA